MNNLGAKIRELRKQAKKTQEEMAPKLGITSQYLSKIERGHAQPSVEVLNKIAHQTGRQLIIIFWDNN